MENQSPPTTPLYPFVLAIIVTTIVDIWTRAHIHTYELTHMHRRNTTERRIR